MKDDKTTIRQRLKQLRVMTDGEERQAKSAQINEQLLSLVDWSQVHFLHYFEPLLSLGEVDITGFIDSLGKAHPGIELFTSRQFEDVWQVVPVDGTENVRTPAFDVIIVPMLGFDPQTLHRIGYGGGFYDTLLATQSQAQKIGVCFEQGKVKNLPVEAHDMPLDQVVTDTTTYTVPLS